MVGKWLYSSWFMKCCFQDLFKTACSIRVYFPCRFFPMYFVRVKVVHPYNSIDTATVWKKSRFILLDKSDFYIIYNLSIACNTFARIILTSLSVEEILLLMYMNWSTNFRVLPLRVEMALSYLKHMYSVLLASNVEAKAFCLLLQAIQLGFCLGWCIWKKSEVICVFCVCHSFLCFSMWETIFFY